VNIKYNRIYMPTLNQLVRNSRKIIKKKKDPVLGRAPQRSGTCTKVYVSPPKKPNSANRACAKITLTNASKKYHKGLKKEVIAYIPYEGHNLKQHSSVMIQRRNKVDLPGVRFVVMRGKGDLQGVLKSRQGRSLKGNKKPAASN
jgi:small subunit ribosomal protein S12